MFKLFFNGSDDDIIKQSTSPWEKVGERIGTNRMNMTKKMKKTQITYVKKSDLPFACPTPKMKLWAWHPRVYLPLEEEKESVCPYCSSIYRLVDE